MDPVDPVVWINLGFTMRAVQSAAHSILAQLGAYGKYTAQPCKHTKPKMITPRRGRWWWFATAAMLQLLESTANCNGDRLSDRQSVVVGCHASAWYIIVHRALIATAGLGCSSRSV